jgi:hypothetical protein
MWGDVEAVTILGLGFHVDDKKYISCGTAARKQDKSMGKK